MPPITRQLAQHIARVSHADLPQPALLAAKRSLLDAIGVSLGASGLEPACAPFVALAQESNGPCSLLGFPQRVSPPMAAFANGALAHALDYEDAYDGTPAHPNAACVPVALALAERDRTIDGRALVVALATGCDLVCRLALALEQNPDSYGFYTPPILGAFGAAATAAKLLALDEDRIVATLGLTLTQAMCSSQFKRDPESALRAVRDAFSAQAGLTAALLAARGARAFEAAIEGEFGLYGLFARGAYAPQRLLEGLGRDYFGALVSFKPWPSCRGTHPFIEAALRMQSQGIAPEDVVCCSAYGASLNRMLAEPVAQKQSPTTAIDAKFSIPFCVALAITRGAVTLDDFSPAALVDARVLALARRVSFVAEPGAGMRDATRGRLELCMRDGTSHSLLIEQPLGHPSRPLDDARLIAKFVDCAGRAASPLSAEHALAAAEAILAIDLAPRAGDALSLLRLGQG